MDVDDDGDTDPISDFESEEGVPGVEVRSILSHYDLD